MLPLTTTNLILPYQNANAVNQIANSLVIIADSGKLKLKLEDGSIKVMADESIISNCAKLNNINTFTVAQIIKASLSVDSLSVANTIETNSLVVKSTVQANSLVIINDIQTNNLTVSNTIQTNSLTVSTGIQANSLSVTTTIQANSLAVNTISANSIQANSSIQADIISANTTKTNILIVGQGTPLQKAISVVANLDFPATAKNVASDLTINVPGAAIGDVVSLGVPASAVMPNSCYSAWVSATDTITIRFNNYSTASLNPPLASFRVEVKKY